MRRFFTALILIALVVSMAACSSQQPLAEAAPTPTQQAVIAAPPPETAAPTATPEPIRYVPMDLLGKEFNPFAEMEFPAQFSVAWASFSKGVAKLEGNSPFTLSLYAEGDMKLAVSSLAKIAGLSEEDILAKIKDYMDYGSCEFTDASGHGIDFHSQKPNDADGGNGACIANLNYNVPDAELEKYTALIRDNYNVKALASFSDVFPLDTDFAECSIEVNLQKNEANIAVQYYVDNLSAVQQRVSEDPKSEMRDWNGIPAADLTNGLIRSTLIFDSKNGQAILVSQTSKELTAVLSDYVEPEFSLMKFGFGFDDAGVCGVYEQHEPHYMNVAIHRPEWGDFAEGWNIEYLDQVNGYGLRITYDLNADSYHISLDKDNKGAAFEYSPAKGENGYSGDYPDSDTVMQMFNAAFGTEGKDFYAKPLESFKQLVQERFGMSIEELYALPKQ